MEGLGYSGISPTHITSFARRKASEVCVGMWLCIDVSDRITINDADLRQLLCSLVVYRTRAEVENHQPPGYASPELDISSELI